MDVLRFTLGDGAGLFGCGVGAAAGFLACLVHATLGKRLAAILFAIMGLGFLAVAVLILVTTNRVAGGG